MTDERSPLAVGHETVQSVSKVVLGIASLVFLTALAAQLPGLDLLVPGTPITLGAAIVALATVVVVGLLAYLAAGLAALAKAALGGPRAVVENAASVVYWVVVLVAVLVAHEGFAPVVAPVLGDAVWVYDLAALLVALVPLVFVAARLSVALDPAADLFAGPPARPSARNDSDPARETSREGTATDTDTDAEPDRDSDDPNHEVYHGEPRE